MKEYSNSLARRAQRLAQLFSLLSHVFQYPNMQAARWLVSNGYPDYAQSLCDSLTISLPVVDGFLSLGDPAIMINAAASRLRVEGTKLFYTGPNRIELHGAKWIQNQTLISWKRGEAYAVSEEYLNYKLVGKPGTNVRADHMINELDFLAYLYLQEADAWEASDVERVGMIKRDRTDFAEYHFSDMAQGVSNAMLSVAQEPAYVLTALLLERLVSADC